MMNKLTSWPVSVSVFIVAIAIGYYFALFLPNAETQKNLVLSQASCLQMQQLLLKDLKTSTKNNIFANNHFNLKLKKCFVELFSGNIDGTQWDEIYDAVENNLVAALGCSLRSDANGQFPCSEITPQSSAASSQGQIKEFNTLKQQYMTN